MSDRMRFKIRGGSFTSVPDSLIEDSQVSADCFRLVCWLFSHKEGFEIRRNHIGERLGFGEHRLRKALSEAKKLGALRTVQGRDRNGRLTSSYEIATDCRFSTRGKSTPLKRNTTTPSLTSDQAAFLEIWPSAPSDFRKFQRLHSEALARFSEKVVRAWATDYAQKVEQRTRGGGIAKPENHIWRKLNPEADQVIDDAA